MIEDKEIKKLINQSLENKKILKGVIVKISKLNIVVSINDKNNKDALVYIPIEESNLYIARLARDEKEKMIFLQRAIGKVISFIIIKFDVVDGIKMPIGSMKEAAKQWFAAIKKIGLDRLEKVVKVNIISSGYRFAQIEYNGYVSTVSDRELSYSEVSNVNRYILRNDVKEFEIVRIDPELEYMEFSRKDVIGDVFQKRVYDEKAFKINDVVMGEIVGDTNDDRMIVELEPEIIAIARYPKDRVKFGGKVSGIISGINKGKRKIYLSSVNIL